MNGYCTIQNIYYWYAGTNFSDRILMKALERVLVIAEAAWRLCKVARGIGNLGDGGWWRRGGYRLAEYYTTPAGRQSDQLRGLAKSGGMSR